jgi:TrmH family RNA methyltransferase
MLSSREAKELSALRERKNRAESGRFLAEGVRVVEDLLSSPLRISWVASSSSVEDGSRTARLIKEIDRRGIPHRKLDPSEFGGYTATETPQGVIAVVETPRTRLQDLNFGATRSLVLLVDAIQDPGNLGTIIRSAEAFAAEAIVLLPGTVDPWNPKVVRAAAGSAFRVPIAESPWDEAAEYLRRRGFRLLGASKEGPPIAEKGDRIALVLGNEGAGISDEVRAGLDVIISIPLPGRAESLNVAAAAAILLYELTR